MRNATEAYLSASRNDFIRTHLQIVHNLFNGVQINILLRYKVKLTMTIFLFKHPWLIEFKLLQTTSFTDVIVKKSVKYP